MTRNLLSAMLIFSVVLLSQPVTAAELSGTVYSQGSPVANLTVAVRETGTQTKTGPKGEYMLSLAPGDRKSTRLNSSHIQKSRMPSSA